MDQHLLWVYGLQMYLAATPFGFAPFFSLNIDGIGAEKRESWNSEMCQKQGSIPIKVSWIGEVYWPLVFQSILDHCMKLKFFPTHNFHQTFQDCYFAVFVQSLKLLGSLEFFGIVL